MLRSLTFVLLSTALTAQEVSTLQTGLTQPEIGFVLDASMTSGKEDGQALGLDMAELSFSSRIDPFGRAFAIIEFPGIDELEVAEAVMIFDQLGDGWEVRGGRMLMDLGKWNTIHQHDMPMPGGNPTANAMFGGKFQGTGVELHKWMSLGDAPIRFSVGAWSDFGSHAHEDEHGHDEEEHDHGGGMESGTDGAKHFADWAFSGRLTSQMDLGQNGWWQWGLSAFSSQSGLMAEWENELDENDPLFASGEEFGLGFTSIGADLSMRTASLADASWNMLGVEWWQHEQDHAHAEGGAQVAELERPSLQAIYALAEHGWSKEWSTSAHFSWTQGEEEEVISTTSRYGIAMSRHFSEFHRFRFAYERLEVPGEETADQFTIQWSAFMGAHRHGLDW